MSKKLHFDSGYHGTTDDEMDINQASAVVPSDHKQLQITLPEQSAPAPPTHSITSSSVILRRSNTESFVSAREDLGSRKPSQESMKGDSQATIQDDNMVVTHALVEDFLTQVEHPAVESAIQESSPVVQPQPADFAEDRMDVDDFGSPSDGSSPLKPLLRKSSLTFAALPAREPLAKTSFGGRTSHVDASKSFGGDRASQFGRMTGGRITNGPQPLASTATDDDHIDTDAVARPLIGREESETTKIHNKTSTQRLHDRINMLGQSRDVRTSKSTHFNSSTDKQLYPQLTASEAEKTANDQARMSVVKEPTKQHTTREVEDDDDDWIAPIMKSGPAGKEPSRSNIFGSSRAADFVEQVSNKLAGLDSPRTRHGSPYKSGPGHREIKSTTILQSPTRAAMAPAGSPKKIAVSNPTPSIHSFDEPTTPIASPPRSPSGRKLLDGPLSASKAKLYSVLKSAKGIFASSAGVSAQAKMEALSPPRMRRPPQAEDPPLSPSAEVRPTPALYPNMQSARPQSPLQDGRRTRSSSEREQKRKQEQEKKAATELDKAREKERQKATAAAQKANRMASPSKERLAASRLDAPSRTDTESSKETLPNSDGDMPPPPPPKSMLPTTQAQRLREPRRAPVPRPQNQPASRAKPAPVTVRMPSQRIGHVQPSNTALNQSLHDTLPPPPPPKAGLGMHPNSSTNSLKSNGKKALEAAAKKREQEAKAAQRKAEQKRELEQRRAAKQEEERRNEQQRKAAEQQRKIAEQQRIQDAKKAAQRQAVEARRVEQQRKEVQRPDSRQQNTLVRRYYQIT